MSVGEEQQGGIAAEIALLTQELQPYLTGETGTMCGRFQITDVTVEEEATDYESNC